jgi:hypothetical protein
MPYALKADCDRTLTNTSVGKRHLIPSERDHLSAICDMEVIKTRLSKGLDKVG